MKIETTVIPALRKVYSDTYASFPTTGLNEGDLAWATDRECFYRWSGAAWEAIGISTRHGNIADIGNPADYPESSLYQADDEGKCYMLVSGAWVSIAEVGRLDMTRMPRGTLDYVLRAKGAEVNPAYEALSLAEDITGFQSNTSSAVSSGWQYIAIVTAPGGNAVITSKTLDYAINSMAVAVGAMQYVEEYPNTTKLGLYMGGVKVSESGYLTSGSIVLVDTKGLSGLVECNIAVHNYHASQDSRLQIGASDALQGCSAMIGIGSVKIS